MEFAVGGWRRKAGRLACRMVVVRRLLCWGLVGSGALVVGLAAYLGAAVVLGWLSVNRDYVPAESGVDVYLVTNGIHADLVVPIDALDVHWAERLPLPAWDRWRAFGGDLAFGWGDRGFYIETPTWGDLRVSTALFAVTGLDTSVLHVEVVRVPAPGASTRHVRLSPPAYRRLAAFISSTFGVERGEPALPIPGAHYGNHDAFYAAKGHYSLLQTCNEWTRRGLQDAGVRVPVWSPFDKALLLRLTSEP